MASSDESDDCFLMDEQSQNGDDDSSVEMVKPKKASKVLASSTAVNVKSTAASKPSAAATKPSKKKAKTVEETYQKVSQLEHILIRPDTYSKST